MGESQHRDGPRIAVDDYFELRTWAKRFGVTAGDVRRAAKIVGDRASDIEAHLQQSGPMPLDGAAGYAQPAADEPRARKPAH